MTVLLHPVFLSDVLSDVIGVTTKYSAEVILRKLTTSVFGTFLGTNLIHDFTAVTFSVKLASFREKRPFP